VPGSRPPRIALVVSSLALGGTERVVALLAEGWARRRVPVTVVTVLPPGGDFFPLPDGVRRRTLVGGSAPPGGLGPGPRFLARAWQLRRLLREEAPDHVLGFGAMTGVLAAVAAAGIAPVVVAERTYPGHHAAGWARDRARLWSYGRAAAVVAQTGRAASWIRRAVPGARVTVIPNPLSPDLDGVPGGEPREAMVLSVGRLSPEKGHRVLCEAWSRIEASFPDWRLAIVGEGPERAGLELHGGLAARGRLVLAGALPRPDTWMRRAPVFVLPSLAEGFPNALLEAMACGCAVVASDCEAGPAELVGSDAGVLVPPADPAALAGALDLVLRDASLRARLGLAAREAVAGYGLEPTLDRWEQVMRDTARGER
jgi:GalNAc-alpha-(1->4)-GalNAc-alpha-(1->3)-diNAcBac-PP-undecaprenol alpha-1,4-N-acetyl-D-galactosaminyltransferase